MKNSVRVCVTVWFRYTNIEKFGVKMLFVFFKEIILFSKDAFSW